LQHLNIGVAMDFEIRQERSPQGRKKLVRERAGDLDYDQSPVCMSFVGGQGFAF